MRVGQYRLPPDIAARVRSGHPWIFRDALGSRDVSEPTGAVVDLITGNQDFVCRGYVDREHAIAVRVLTRDPGERVAPGAGVIGVRFARALQLRWILWAGQTMPSAMRLFSGESEGLPGRDRRPLRRVRRGAVAVRRARSAGATSCTTRSRRRRSRAGSTSSAGSVRWRGRRPPEPAVRARGDEAPLEIVVEDGGCRFGVDVTAPLGVGLFPDMRLGWAGGRRARVGATLPEPVLVHGRLLGVRGQGGRTRGHGRRSRGQGPRARAPQLRAVGPRSGEDGIGERRRDQDPRALRVARASLRCHRLRPADFLARSGRSVQRHARPGAGGGGGAAGAGAGRASWPSPPIRPRSRPQSSIAPWARGRPRRASICGSFQRVGLPPDFPVAPGFPEGNYLKVALAIRA